MIFRRPVPKVALLVFCLAILTTIPSNAYEGTNNRSALVPTKPFAGLPAAPILSNPTTEYAIPSANSGPDGIASGPRGILWFTEFQAGKIGSFDLAKINSTSPITEYSIPEVGAAPATIAVDGFGRVWFNDENNQSGSIWMFNPANSSFQGPFKTSDPKALPVFVLVDGNDNVWFTEISGDKIGELAYPGYSLTEYSLPTPASGPTEMALQPGTSYLWVTEQYSGKLARFDTSSHAFQEFTPTVSMRYPVGIVADYAENIWVSEHGGSALIQFNTENSTWTKYPTSVPASVPQGYSAPATLSLDSLGRLWFLEHYSNRVGRLNPATRQMVEFALPIQGAYSLLNALDSNGNFWFTEFYANRIGMIPSAAASPVVITSGPSAVLDATAGLSATTEIVLSGAFGTGSGQVSLLGSSSFSDSGQTPTSQVSFNPSTLDLGTGSGALVSVSITPGLTFASGLYSVGLAATYNNYTSILVMFVQVRSFTDTVIAFLPEIVIGVLAVAAGVFLLVRRRRIRKSGQGGTGVTKNQMPGTGFLRFFLLLTIASLVLLSQLPLTPLVLGKCPGLPPPPVGNNFGGGGDPYTFYVDVATGALVGGVLGFVLWKIFKSKKVQPPPPPPGPS